MYWTPRHQPCGRGADWKVGFADGAEAKRTRTRLHMLAFPPDFTFVVQLASFFLLLFLLNKFLFAPYAALLAEREARTTGDSGQADDMRAEAEELEARVQREMADARARAMASVEAVRKDTREQEAALFHDASTKAAARLAELRGGIEDARREASAQLEQDARALAGDMVGAVLGRGGRA